MSSTSTCISKLQQIKDLLGANTGRHLLLHLVSSIAHLTISLVLMFFWMNGPYCTRPSMFILFGAISIAYTTFSVVKFSMAIAHYYFTQRSQKAITITILATSGASAVLACIGIIATVIIVSSIDDYCYYDVVRYPLFICTMTFLGGSVILNVALFGTLLFHWRQQVLIEKTLKGSTSSGYASWGKEPAQFEDIELNKQPKPASTVVHPKSALVPPSAPLYPSHQLGSIASFESLSELTRAKNA